MVRDAPSAADSNPGAGARGASSPARRGRGAGGATATAAAGPVAAAKAGAGTLDDVFRALLDRRDALPAGLGAFLRAATVAEEDGLLRVALPPGPGLERLRSNDAARRDLQRALSRELGHDVSLRLVAADVEGAGAGRPRLTPERVNAERLARLAREEPALGRVVEAWDLELLD